MDEAVVQAVDALDRLRAGHPRQIYFHYVSTFNSTLRGNIGPVCDALLREMESDFTLAVPATPAHGRTQYAGHLFVDGVLLNESPLRTHPLHPMKDANLVRWLRHQTTRHVGLLPLRAVCGDLLAEAARLRASGVEIALADAVSAADLDALAEAFADLPLLTGSSGLGGSLPAAWTRRGWLQPTEVAPAVPGRSLILAGSCSAITLAQLAALGGSQILINVRALVEDGERETKRVLKLARQQLKASGHAVVRSSATAEEREAIGLDGRLVAEELDTVFGVLAATLADEVAQLIVAGADTAVAVTAALGVEAVEVLRLAAPGVPAMRPVNGPEMTLVLKPGERGGPDFFRQAVGYI